MKSRRIVIFLSSLCVLCCISCGEHRPPVQVDESKLVYFKPTYEESRKAFLDAAGVLKQQYRNVTVSAMQVKSAKDDSLFIDTCYVPAQGKGDRLLVLFSGVHGIEGFTGSAVQRFIMKELLSSWDLGGMGVLFVHAVNPYGFKYKRRVTEHNVDLNRDLAADRSIFKLGNEGYAKLNFFLNPVEKADSGSMGNRFFAVRAVYNILKYSMKALRDAILKGQYEFDKGIYFGGRDFEPQKEILERLVKESAKGSHYVFFIDLHTGYGERGKLHLFPNPVKEKDKRARMETIFKGYQVDWGDEGDFYVTVGDTESFLGSILPKGTKYIPMTFEFGTMDSQTTMGSIRSIQNVILENQGAHYGYVSGDSKKDIEERFIESYYPTVAEWRSEVIRQVKEMLPLFIDRFAKLKD